MSFPRLTPSRLFGLWLAGRTLAWVALATLTQAHPPLDTVEWLAWGREWQLGYHKHPPLGAWAVEVGYRLTPGSFLGVYLVGYAFIAAALWAVWALARRVVPPWPALAAVVCLDGLVFVGQAAAEVNNQVPLIAFWALAVYWFHQAWQTDRWRYWAATGAALGLGALCKYSIAFLAVSLLGLWVWRNGTRRLSRPAVVMLVALAVFLPHFVWLWRNDFPTLRYAARRAQGEASGAAPRAAALAFVGSQGLRLVPVVMVVLPVLAWRRLTPPRPLRCCGAGVPPACACCRRDACTTTAEGAGLRLGPPTTPFLLTAALGPAALHLLAAVALGLQLRDIWGAPLWTFTGLLLVALLPTTADPRAWRRLAACWAVVFTAWLALSGWANLARHAKLCRVQYPGRALTAAVCGRYAARYGAPPAVVAGDWWLAGSVCCLAPHRPPLYGSLEPARPGMDLNEDKGDPERFREPQPCASPWVSDAELLRQGGVILWDAGAFGDGEPAWLRRRFPQARLEPPLALPGLRVGWAAVPPAHAKGPRSPSASR